MKISVVIPCKNEEAVLGDLLGSLAAQTRPADEIVVVDSHCTDNTISLAKSYSDRLPMVVVAAEEKGVAHARNTGGKKADGDYLVFLDADAIVPSHFIERIEASISQKGWEVAGISQRMPSKKRGLRIGARVMNGYARVMAHTPWPIAMSSLVSSHKAFETLEGFDPKIWIMEDYDYALRAHRAGFQFGIITNTYFNASDRRFTNTGTKDSLKGIYAELYRYTHGLRITKPLYRYDMGGTSSKKSK